MTSESRHLSIFIDRPAAEVYAFAGDPANLPSWAAGVSASIAEVDGQWVSDSPLGRVVIAFVAANDLGVLDHRVTLPSGESVLNPMRVLPADPGCEVVFTVRRSAGMSAEDFARDGDAVAADLRRLRDLMERGGR